MSLNDSPPPEGSTSPSQQKRKRDEPHAPEIEIDVNLPEPPSKKELRKAKRQKSDPSAESTASKSANDASADTSTTKRSDYSIWIGNLPWAIDKLTLRSFFTENSTVVDEDITRVHMPAPPDAKASRQTLKPQNKGFAYVDFATAEVRDAALALSETMLGGRRVLIKDAKSFEGRPDPKNAGSTSAPGTASQNNAGGKTSNKKPAKRVFVGNLAFDVTKEALTEHFEKCGEVENVHVATFEDSGKCKGFGWVTFVELSAAEDAVKGWTLVQPEMEEEEDVEEENAEAGNVDGADEEHAKKNSVKAKRKPKPRKWFVNKIFGRYIRCEFAEDATSRYKKRFGKDGRREDASTGAEQGSNEVDEAAELPKENVHPFRRPRVQREDGISPGAGTDAAKRRRRSHVAPASGQSDARYRTGVITEATGSKTVFE